MDNSKGLKCNRITLNLAQAGSLEPPEPGVAAVIIDGVPIIAPRSINISAGCDQLTICQIVFECEVAGNIGGADVKDILRQSED